MSEVPIPDAPAKDKTAIEQLVNKAIKAKQDDPSADVSRIESEIDHLVYKLYNFTQEEIAAVEERYK